MVREHPDNRVLQYFQITHDQVFCSRINAVFKAQRVAWKFVIAPSRPINKIQSNIRSDVRNADDFIIFSYAYRINESAEFRLIKVIIMHEITLASMIIHLMKLSPGKIGRASCRERV